MSSFLWIQDFMFHWNSVSIIQWIKNSGERLVRGKRIFNPTFSQGFNSPLDPPSFVSNKFRIYSCFVDISVIRTEKGCMISMLKTITILFSQILTCIRNNVKKSEQILEFCFLWDLNWNKKKNVYWRNMFKVPGMEQRTFLTDTNNLNEKYLAVEKFISGDRKIILYVTF